MAGWKMDPEFPIEHGDMPASFQACHGGILRVSWQPHPNIYHPQLAFRGGIPGLGPPPTAKVQCSRTNFHQQCCNRQAQGPQQSRKDTSSGEALGGLVAQPLVFVGKLSHLKLETPIYYINIIV